MTNMFKRVLAFFAVFFEKPRYYLHPVWGPIVCFRQKVWTYDDKSYEVHTHGFYSENDFLKVCKAFNRKGHLAVCVDYDWRCAPPK